MHVSIALTKCLKRDDGAGNLGKALFPGGLEGPHLQTHPGAKAVVRQQPCLVSEGSDPAGFRLYAGTPVIHPWRGRIGAAATSLLRGRAPGWGTKLRPGAALVRLCSATLSPLCLEPAEGRLIWQSSRALRCGPVSALAPALRQFQLGEDLQGRFCC